MKLSKTQLAMLERLGTGDTLSEHHLGPDVWYSWEDEFSTKGIRSTTVFRLWKLGLIMSDGDWRAETWTITAKGREYLGNLK